MTQVAIIVSPGHNTEVETYRELTKVGLDVKIHRWNEEPDKILSAESFLIPGGFSYEDRGRSGLISAQNPIMKAVQEQALNGKPLIGICNGAQAVVEMALVPGDKNNTKALALAKNKRIQHGEVIGTGYYNTSVHIKLAVPQTRTPYTLLVPENTPIIVPIAHGEGRYTTVYPELPNLLLENQQVIFQYCTPDGQVIDEFPTNPNGAMLNAAAISNVHGNIISIMPHPERGLVAPVASMFASLKKYLEEKPKLISFTPYKLKGQKLELSAYNPKGETIVVKDTITDNEAYTLQNTLNKLVSEDVQVDRFTHYEIEAATEDLKTTLQSGQLYNSNKQTEANPKLQENDFALIVSYIDDTEGQSIAEKVNKQYETHVQSVRKSTIWVFRNINPEVKEKILDTQLFCNINSQIAYEYL